MPDFITFYNDPYTLFEDDLPDMFRVPESDRDPPVFTDYPDTHFTAFLTEMPLEIETDEAAFLRFGLSDQPFADLPNVFDEGEGTRFHRTVMEVEQDHEYTYYIRAADYYGNVTDTALVISFNVDTMQVPVIWNELLYEPRGWCLGKAPLGYGNEGSDSTETQTAETVYFRHVFTLSDSVEALGFLIKCHDGAVVHLNGREIGRINMPAEVEIEHETRALSDLHNSPVLVLTAEQLRSLVIGENLLAVEVHQAGVSDPDMSFDARIFNQDGIFMDLGSEWHYYDAGDRPGDQLLSDVTEVITGVDAGIPRKPALHPNFPNPFNPVTRIAYDLPMPGRVRISVFDVQGRQVRILKDEHQKAGRYVAIFSADDLPSGIYFCRLTLGYYSSVQKMMFMK